MKLSKRDLNYPKVLRVKRNTQIFLNFNISTTINGKHKSLVCDKTIFSFHHRKNIGLNKFGQYLYLEHKRCTSILITDI